MVFAGKFIQADYQKWMNPPEIDFNGPIFNKNWISTTGISMDYLQEIGQISNKIGWFFTNLLIEENKNKRNWEYQRFQELTVNR